MICATLVNTQTDSFLLAKPLLIVKKLIWHGLQQSAIDSAIIN